MPRVHMIGGVTQPEAGSRENLSQWGSEELGLHWAAVGKQRGPDAQWVATQRPWWLPCDGKEKPNLPATGAAESWLRGPCGPRPQVIPSRAALALSRPHGHGRDGAVRAEAGDEKEEGVRVGGRID